MAGGGEGTIRRRLDALRRGAGGARPEPAAASEVDRRRGGAAGMPRRVRAAGAELVEEVRRRLEGGRRPARPEEIRRRRTAAARGLRGHEAARKENAAKTTWAHHRSRP